MKQDWGAQPTIFSEARQLGAAIDIVGWHLPYCAIFGLLLHRCWTGSDLRSLPMPVRMLWEMDVALGLTPSDRILRLYASGHLALVEGQIAELHRAIEDTAADLVFLHLAIPHFPWIYDRQRGAFSTDRLTEPNGYPDNLALADAVLGDIVRAVERSPRADSTVLMVTGDHPYHVPPAYGQRDSLVPDPRVPFLVRLPGQHRTLTFGARIETIVTPGLALALLADSIRGPDDLARWLSVHSAEAQP